MRPVGIGGDTQIDAAASCRQNKSGAIARKPLFGQFVAMLANVRVHSE